MVAEYAIAMALRDGERCVYTSPLKALSNQKFRELQEEFGDVGLLTGDNTVNPNASCLVMTTEILRSMLYRGSELVSSCRWLIMDEIHYMRDRERGVVWEESIALAPRGARFVFLSANLPTAPAVAGAAALSDLERRFFGPAGTAAAALASAASAVPPAAASASPRISRASKST